jgi:hypothetical protein
MGGRAMSYPKYRWTSRSKELENDIARLQSKLEKENLTSTAINEISDIIESKKSDLKNIRENRYKDIPYMTTEDE